MIYFEIIKNSYNQHEREKVWRCPLLTKTAGEIQTNTEPIILWEFLSKEKGQLLTVLNKLTFIKKNAGHSGRKEGGVLFIYHLSRQ